MRIAYIGPGWGTSLHRAKALERLGHQVVIIDPWSWLADSILGARIHFHTGYVSAGLFIDQRLFRDVRMIKPDLIWVNQGEFLGPSSLRMLLKAASAPIVNYTNDDPFSISGRRRFTQYRRALPWYDLIAIVRESNVLEAKRAGARRVVRIWMSADEVVHCLQNAVDSERVHSVNQVTFVGTWMPERGPFMAALIRQGIPVKIWGDNWQKAKDWQMIKPNWCGPGIHEANGYAKVIQSSKICLGLLSKGNRDLHTRRSAEIPALGSLFCAERTDEHLALYEEGQEAVFWSDAAECAAICKELLANEPRRAEIARRGHERALHNNLFNEPVLASILKEVSR